eukprot:TRINITY_DN29997_c0_g1_i1.p1 TRINITY_DN29997_c0_g1~~TRINITY_DN29997_c0_g1_i1.p1  ORF type:complete len:1085 (-),score=185.33 TRINITY_DN29997_c0_g1_i1:54-2924(-)
MERVRSFKAADVRVEASDELAAADRSSMFGSATTNGLEGQEEPPLPAVSESLPSPSRPSRQSSLERTKRPPPEQPTGLRLESTRQQQAREAAERRRDAWRQASNRERRVVAPARSAGSPERVQRSGGHLRPSPATTEQESMIASSATDTPARPSPGDGADSEGYGNDDAGPMRHGSSRLSVSFSKDFPQGDWLPGGASDGASSHSSPVGRRKSPVRGAQAHGTHSSPLAAAAQAEVAWAVAPPGSRLAMQGRPRPEALSGREDAGESDAASVPTEANSTMAADIERTSSRRLIVRNRWTHQIDLAERWAANHAARPPVAAAAITYPSGVAVDLFELAELLQLPEPRTGATHRLQLAWSLETGSFAQAALQTYRAVDSDSEGGLSWYTGKLHDFVTTVFKDHQLDTLTDIQVYRAYSLFDQGRSAPLDARDCLCLVDALLRVVIRCARSAGVTLAHVASVATSASAAESMSVSEMASIKGPSRGGSLECQMPRKLPATQFHGLPSDVEHWSPSDVAKWAVGVLGLPDDLGDLLIGEEIRGSVLLSLVEPDLERLGVKPFGRRRQLLLGIRSLQENHLSYCSETSHASHFSNGTCARSAAPQGFLSTLPAMERAAPRLQQEHMENGVAMDPSVAAIQDTSQLRVPSCTEADKSMDEDERAAPCNMAATFEACAAPPSETTTAASSGPVSFCAQGSAPAPAARVSTLRNTVLVGLATAPGGSAEVTALSPRIIRPDSLSATVSSLPPQATLVASSSSSAPPAVVRQQSAGAMPRGYAGPTHYGSPGVSLVTPPGSGGLTPRMYLNGGVHAGGVSTPVMPVMAPPPRHLASSSSAATPPRPLMVQPSGQPPLQPQPMAIMHPQVYRTQQPAAMPPTALPTAAARPPAAMPPVATSPPAPRAHERASSAPRREADGTMPIQHLQQQLQWLQKQQAQLQQRHQQQLQMQTAGGGPLPHRPVT